MRLDERHNEHVAISTIRKLQYCCSSITVFVYTSSHEQYGLCNVQGCRCQDTNGRLDGQVTRRNLHKQATIMRLQTPTHKCDLAEAMPQVRAILWLWGYRYEIASLGSRHGRCDQWLVRSTSLFHIIFSWECNHRWRPGQCRGFNLHYSSPLSINPIPTLGLNQLNLRCLSCVTMHCKFIFLFYTLVPLKLLWLPSV